MVIIACVEMAQNNKSDKFVTLSSEVPCTVDTTVHVQERGSVYRAVAVDVVQSQ